MAVENSGRLPKSNGCRKTAEIVTSFIVKRLPLVAAVKQRSKGHEGENGVESYFNITVPRTIKRIITSESARWTSGI